VVAKLFNIVQPDVAVFGRKDLQQAALVKAMVRDLNFPVRIVVSATVREEDGLALSSRNTYLSPADRRAALALVQSLRAASAVFDEGEREVRAIETAGRDTLARTPQVSVDYFAVVNTESFAHAPIAAPSSAVIVAARVGPTRLIDNIILGENDQN
jgi:pantoate--beta-alanine ligase